MALCSRYRPGIQRVHALEAPPCEDAVSLLPSKENGEPKSALRGHMPPPPFCFVAAFLLGVMLHHWIPLGGPLPSLLVYLAWFLLVFSALLAGSAFASLLRVRTTIRPDHPPTALVSTGPYRFTRNPMYLSLVLLHLGLALQFQMVWPVLLLPFAVWIVHVRNIPKEEEQLRQHFAEDYTRYCGQVRRWL